jgi:hypothetical protein
MLWILQLLDSGECDVADSITWCHDVNGKPSFGDISTNMSVSVVDASQLVPQAQGFYCQG